jgi:hypothetical protein
VKKIPIWKIILLSIITLGIYTIVWFALRRVELSKGYDLRTPHWLWLVLPALIGFILWFASLILIYTAFTNDPGRQYDWMMLSTYIFLLLIPFGISLWWVDRFGQAVQTVTANRVPVLWTMLLYFFLGPAVIVVHQYYFNRLKGTRIPSTRVGPSQRFIIIASLVIAIMAIMSLNSWLTFPESYHQSREDFLSSIKQD